MDTETTDTIHDSDLLECREVDTPTDPRQTIRDLFVEIIGADAARRVERSCYNQTIDEAKRDAFSRNFDSREFIHRYSAHAARIVYNLRSSELVERVRTDRLFSNGIAKLDDVQLFPDPTQKIREQIQIRREVRVEEKIMTQYTCYECKGHKMIRKEYQGASADELTRFALACLECGTTRSL